MVVVVDDREDVWRGIGRSQLLLVQPFKYFTEALEINNAPGDSSTSDCSNDAQLQYLLSALRGIHAMYYGKVGNDQTHGDHQLITQTSEIINMMRSSILQGCVLLCQKSEVREIISRGYLEIAHMMGAEIAEGPDDRITHLLCLKKPDTDIYRGLNLRDTSFTNSTCLLNAEWIRSCNWAMSRVDENSFLYGYVEKEFLPSIGKGVLLKSMQKFTTPQNIGSGAFDEDEDMFMKEIEAGYDSLKDARGDE